MRVEFLQSAEDEFAEAIAYYNEQSEGLGLELAVELKRTIGRILDYPFAWMLLATRTRRCRLNRFPYAVLYQVRDSLILVVAIQNLHKHPESWKSRLMPDAL